MKTIIALITLAVAVFATGCTSLQKHLGENEAVQAVLDLLVPPTFVGNATVKHKNPQLTVHIKAINLRKVDGKWVWDNLEYTREGRLTDGLILLEPYTAPAN